MRKLLTSPRSTHSPRRSRRARYAGGALLALTLVVLGGSPASAGSGSWQRMYTVPSQWQIDNDGLNIPAL
jgi:hypothetical protein